ncbi:hypothetical protein [Amycolatopsis sp. A1MSW2902]
MGTHWSWAERANRWVFADPTPFDEPIPGRGPLGLYWLPADWRIMD